MSDAKKTNKLGRLGNLLRELGAYDLNGVDVQVLCYIASITVDKAQDGLQKNQARISRARLQEQLGVTESTVRRSIARLIDGGFIGISYQGSSYARHSNVYNVYFKPDREAAIKATLKARGETEWKLPKGAKPVRRRVQQEDEENHSVHDANHSVHDANHSVHDANHSVHDGPSGTSIWDSSSATNISVTIDAEAEDSSVIKADEGVSAQVADRVEPNVLPFESPVSEEEVPIELSPNALEPNPIARTANGEVFSVLDDDGLHKRGSLHSHSSSAQQPHHVATNNTSDSYGDNTEPDWSNGVDSHDDPSEYRTAEDTPRDSFKVIQGGRSLYDSLLNQQ